MFRRSAGRSPGLPELRSVFPSSAPSAFMDSDTNEPKSHPRLSSGIGITVAGQPPNNRRRRITEFPLSPELISGHLHSLLERAELHFNITKLIQDVKLPPTPVNRNGTRNAIVRTEDRRLSEHRRCRLRDGRHCQYLRSPAGRKSVRRLHHRALSDRRPRFQ